MIRTILVPLDGSRLAEQALPTARRLATRTDAAVALVRIVPTGPYVQAPLPAHRATVEEAAEFLRGAARSLSSDGVTVHTAVYRDGPVAEAILRAATAQGADLIVMSTHGRSGLRRVVLGSVAERVLQATTLPLVLVRGYPRPGFQREGAYCRILVPLDGTPPAESALRYVAGEAFARDAELLLLYSGQPARAPVAPGVLRDGPEQACERIGQESAGERAAARQYLGATTRAHLDRQAWHVHGDPATAILDFADDQDIELIALATHGRTGLGRLTHGSVATHVVHHADVPVLLLRESRAAASAGPSRRIDEIGL